MEEISYGKLFCGDGYLWPPMSIKCWVMGMSEPQSTGISKGISLYGVHLGCPCAPPRTCLWIYIDQGAPSSKKKNLIYHEVYLVLKGRFDY